ncbi:TlpA family protein disulfide reductase [Aquimarina sp. TRL1]|uniref:TlpA family protein disulfide reductase n=1 Tax=Aquimarina sp. (strain TRL1) TaxID=2736252 RepID=UPI00158E6AC8|nr:TlpA disulfide reductase family protein [Aquimarina sp. TRL1]QKX07023.1 TlpA family protein disulfide reductase [Aquimarina sp. TRL1]
MNKKSFWIGFTVGGFLFVLTVIVLYFKFVIQPDISLNQVEVSNLNGTKVELNEYLGKPLVVNYWATWCVPCIKEFPYFEEVKKQVGENVNFIMISDESLAKITKFSESKPYNFKYLKSVKKLSEYGINTRPTTYFYNAQGKLITKHTSNLDSESLKKIIEKIE